MVAMSSRLGNGYTLFLALLLPFQVRTAFEFDTESLRVAVSAWCQDEASAEATYGHISAWDTSRVKSFRGLFMLAAWEGHCSTAATFNADISNACESRVLPQTRRDAESAVAARIASVPKSPVR